MITIFAGKMLPLNSAKTGAMLIVEFRRRYHARVYTSDESIY